MSKYVKIYNKQGLPLGFKGYNDVSSAIGDANVKLYDENGGLVGYSGQGGSEDYSLKYLTTIARGDGTISFNIWATMGTDYITSISYSTDDGATWETTNNTDNKEANLQIEVDVNEGDKILWKGVAKQTGCYDDDEGDYLGSFFSSTCNFDVEGNVMSLLYGDDFADEKALSYVGQLSCLFYGYNDELTAAVINVEKMILPATTLADNCYQSMFCGCTSLTTAPELPATTLAAGCYQSMFRGCTSLTSITCLATDISATNCTNGWVQNVAASGTFTKAASMSSWTTGNNGIPSGWTTVDYAEAN